MTKTLLYSLAVAALCACATGNQTAQPSIDGEWAVVSIDGKATSKDAGFEPAYLGFNGKQLYGSTSCNQLTGSIAIDPSKGSVDFSQTGCTRMLCHDDQVERALLDALPRVKAYSIKGDTLTLSTSSGKAVVELAKR